MKISDDDRELARELADSFGLKLDPWQERMLALVLWSHRQRPADARAGSGDRDWRPVFEKMYRALAYRYGGTTPLQYREPEDIEGCKAMHEGFRFLHPSPATLTHVQCGAVYNNADLANVVRCVRKAGHLYEHRTFGGDVWSQVPDFR